MFLYGRFVYSNQSTIFNDNLPFQFRFQNSDIHYCFAQLYLCLIDYIDLPINYPPYHSIIPPLPLYLPSPHLLLYLLLYLTSPLPLNLPSPHSPYLFLYLLLYLLLYLALPPPYIPLLFPIIPFLALPLIDQDIMHWMQNRVTTTKFTMNITIQGKPQR